jgi:hypothetical protein
VAGYLDDNLQSLAHAHLSPGNLLAHGILLSPGACSGLIFGPISLVHVSYLRHKWVIRVRVRKQRAD